MKTTFSKAIASTLLASGLALSFVAAPAQANNNNQGDSVKETGKPETLPAKDEKPDNSVKETGKPETLPAKDEKPDNSVKETGKPETLPAKDEKPDNSANGAGQGNNQTSSTNTATTAICSTDNVLLGEVKSTACQNQEGNDTGDKGTLQGLLNTGLFSSFVGTGVDWTLVGKSDKGEGGSFGFFADNGQNKDGAWGFQKELNTNTFVVSLKAGTAYTAYLFQDYDWKKGLTGIFDTIGVALDGNGAGRELSHASVFASNIKTVTPPPVEVPEPATLVGLGLAVGGMLSVRRRKTH